MASSNKHWPSLFRSKPSSSNQRQRDVNNSSLISPAVEERTPEPKPRWNPKPEQIRILESIFNSGMVNPSREEIRRIRIRLEEYGEVGDANVFYWFQNRKSRSKHKQRQLQAAARAGVEPPQQQNPSPPPPVTFMTGHSSSSSSSDNSGHEHMGLTFFTNSPTASVNQQHQQALYQTPNEFLGDPLFYPNGSGQGFFFPDASSDLTIGNSSGILPTELMGFNPSKRYGNEDINLDPQLGYGTVTSLPTTTVTNTSTTSHSLLPTASTTVPSTLYHFQGLGDVGGAAGVELQKVTVFINEVAFEVPAGPFNVRETFGDDAVLVHSSGQLVITNEWGVTLHPLQHGAFYYLM